VGEGAQGKWGEKNWKLKPCCQKNKADAEKPERVSARCSTGIAGKEEDRESKKQKKAQLVLASRGGKGSAGIKASQKRTKKEKTSSDFKAVRRRG